MGYTTYSRTAVPSCEGGGKDSDNQVIGQPCNLTYKAGPRLRLDLDLNLDLDFALDLELDLNFDFGLDLDLELYLVLDLFLGPDPDLDLDIDINVVVDVDLDLDLELDLDLDLNLNLELDLDLDLDSPCSLFLQLGAEQKVSEEEDMAELARTFHHLHHETIPQQLTVLLMKQPVITQNPEPGPGHHQIHVE